MNETFTHATAPEFIGVGDACLTGAPGVGTLPPPGDHPLGGCVPGVNSPPLNADPHGYLRLTDSSNDESGAALYNQAIPATHGLDVMFDQWQYGSTTPNTPADGISFFLVNGDVSLTQPGAFGGSLGYAQKLQDDIPTNPFLPGVEGGYLGIGLDVLGNFFGDWEHRGNGCPPGQRSPAGTGFHVPAPGPNMVTVRGPGEGLEGYCFLTATTSNFTTTGPWPSTLPGNLQGPLASMPSGLTPQEAEALLEPSRRRVHVVLTPAPNPQLTVSIDFNNGAGFQQVLTTPAPTPVPNTYKFGFAGSTGQFTDVHLIRNVVVATETPLPQLSLVKQARQPLPGELTVGDLVPYDFVVTNSGDTTINNIAVTDPKIGAVSCPVTTLAPGETVTCTAVYRVTAEDVANGSIQNMATATGTSDGTEVTSPPSSETVPVVQPPSLELEKAVQTPGPYSVGQTVTFTYTVRNRGGLTINGITVNDDHVHNITCQATTLTPFETPGDTTTCTGTYTITAADGAAGSVTNTATATGTASNGTRVISPEAHQTLEVGAPHLLLAKRVVSQGPFRIGDQVEYAYTVTNDGSVPLTNVVVQDDRVADVVCEATTLAPGQSTTCTGTHTITQADVTPCNPPQARAGDKAKRAETRQAVMRCAVTNIAQAGGTPPSGNQITSDPAAATIIVEVEQGAELALAKRVVSKGPFRVGDKVTYAYTVTNTGGSTVTNVAVTDNLVANVRCEATTLAPGASTTCTGTHTITRSDVTPCKTAKERGGDHGKGKHKVMRCEVTNTATATATDAQGNRVTSNQATATITVKVEKKKEKEHCHKHHGGHGKAYGGDRCEDHDGHHRRVAQEA
ncbi:hypothetical protein NGF19_07060 [Streptomyces sp. RY43-2]|uniref:DUF7507 domain-containing protein n=1 Tax=Streptomyces macrolidinus TaxID=2952607 RepID=A0ABT0ZAM9_9ACTN|nr:hypothetical protein [Streptomyces macrolidinus]MCN9240555.1 hypothetical protein [Streptomyces macrolidinus]